MNKYIPYNITCPLASCSRSNTCARYANYQKAKAEEASFMVLNTDFLQVEGEGCPYHLVSERQRWARGFSRLCKSIPSGNAKYLNVYTPFTQRRFYKAKNGEFPLNPQMQAELLEIFKERGADLSLGFDSWIKKLFCQICVEKLRFGKIASCYSAKSMLKNCDLAK